MSGYPNKITRSDLGPVYEDAVKPANPKTELTAGTFNLMAWQLAGLNGQAARVFSYCKIAASVLTQQTQALAWDPNQALPNIQWTRVGLGSYTWTLPNGGLGVGIYPDANGQSVGAGLLVCKVAPQGTADITGVGAVNPDGVSGTVNCFIAGSAGDPPGFAIWIL